MAGSNDVSEIGTAPQRMDTNDAEAIDLDAQKPEAELPDQNAQRGVQTAEAITLTWSKTSLGLIYVWSVLIQPHSK
jgi:hypothetical protein